jgi:hypothetical protein
MEPPGLAAEQFKTEPGAKGYGGITLRFGSEHRPPSRS